MSWREEPATLRQRAYLVRLSIKPPRELTKGEASDQIKKLKKRRKVVFHAS